MIANPYPEGILRDIDVQNLFRSRGGNTKVWIFQTGVLLPFQLKTLGQGNRVFDALRSPFVAVFFGSHADLVSYRQDARLV